MENKRQVGSSTSSSITADLFGPSNSSSSSSSSTGLFASIFPPPPTVQGRDSPFAGLTGPSRQQDLGNQFGAKYGTPDNKSESSGITSKEKSSIFQNETAQPWNYSSSIYYGGQEIYYPQNQTESHSTFKKDGGEDPYANDSNSASRGNWWQGSLYY